MIKNYLKYLKKINKHKLYSTAKNKNSFEDAKSSILNIYGDSHSDESFTNFLNSSKNISKYANNPNQVPVLIDSLYSRLIHDKSKPQFLNYISLTFDTRKDVLDNNLVIILSNSINNRFKEELKYSSLDRILNKEASFEDILRFKEISSTHLNIGFAASTITNIYSEVVTYLNKFHSETDEFSATYSSKLANNFSKYISFFD